MARREARDAALAEARPVTAPPAFPKSRFRPRGGQARGPGPDRPVETPAGPAPVPAFDFHPELAELPEERPLLIEINGRHVATLLCSPGASRELALGWAFTQGYLASADALHRISEFPNRVSLMVENPSDGGKLWAAFVAAGFSPAAVVPAGHGDDPADGEAGERWMLSRGRFLAVLEQVIERFRDRSSQAGTHWAAAADGDQICVAARDVRRAYAVEKVVGWTLLQEVDRSRLVLCVTGRISVDIAFQAWRAGFPVLASFAMPTADAVEFAEVAGTTLVGRGKDGRRIVYTHGWRLADEEEPGLDGR